MKWRIGLRGRALAGLLAALSLPATLQAQEATAPRPVLDPTAALQVSQAVVGKAVGDYTLSDREGRPVRLSSYRGKPLLVNFIYTGCFQVCPTSTRALLEAFQAMRDSVDPAQFNVVSIGFNLPADSPPAMKAFAAQQRIGVANWEFLSPRAGTVEALTRDFGFTFAPTQAGFDHLLQVTIVAADGRIVRQVYGDAFSADRLGEPLRELLRNQPLPQDVKLADIVDRVRILCSVYDPATGSYRVDYALALEVAGGLTFLVAMLWFFALEWRERGRLRRSAKASAQARAEPAST